MSRIGRGRLAPDPVSSANSTENTDQTSAEPNVAEPESDTKSPSAAKYSTDAAGELRRLGNLQQMRLNELLNEAESALKNGYVEKFQGPNLNASGNDVAIESIEISHEGLELDDDDD